MTVFLIAQVWMLLVGVAGCVLSASSRSPLSPGAWLGLLLVALVPPLAALGVSLLPDIARPSTDLPVVMARAIAVAEGGAAEMRPGIAALLPWLVGVYWTVAVALILRMLARTARLHGIAARARPLNCETARSQPSQGALRSAQLRTTQLDLPPLALGWPTACMLVPQTLVDSLTPDELAMLIAHERTHLDHRDPGLTLALLVVQALNWANPGLRGLVSGWREAIELRADARAVTPATAHSYADLLLRLVGTSRRAQPVPTAIPPSPRRRAEMRLSQILDPKAPRRARPLPLLAAALLGTIGFSGLAIGAGATDIVSADRDAQPVSRPAPRMLPSCPDLDVATVEMAGDWAKVGRVKLRFDVDAAGAPRNIEVTSSNAPCFDQPARENVAKWEYAKGHRLTGVETMIVWAMTPDDGETVDDMLAKFVSRK